MLRSTESIDQTDPWITVGRCGCVNTEHSVWRAQTGRRGPAVGAGHAGVPTMVGREEREPRYAWVWSQYFSGQRGGLRYPGEFRAVGQGRGRRTQAGNGLRSASPPRSASLSMARPRLSLGVGPIGSDRGTIFASGLVILGIGTAALGSIVTLWQAYLVFGVLMSIGFGAASSSTSAVAIAHWFTARRGLAVGIVAGGGAAGQFGSSRSWRHSCRLLAGEPHFSGLGSRSC